ncbi:hypothetical protein [uncultured Slackia sp.]|uniref:hypothetical protein n=1 Tax=uncultured Slackia sp. TaxID=665903 RepID=UPI0025E21583|nr:hypothetical protein [uncultured Slackia sp.]
MQSKLHPRSGLSRKFLALFMAFTLVLSQMQFGFAYASENVENQGADAEALLESPAEESSSLSEESDEAEPTGPSDPGEESDEAEPTEPSDSGEEFQAIADTELEEVEKADETAFDSKDASSAAQDLQNGTVQLKDEGSATANDDNDAEPAAPDYSHEFADEATGATLRLDAVDPAATMIKMYEPMLSLTAAAESEGARADQALEAVAAAGEEGVRVDAAYALGWGATNGVPFEFQKGQAAFTAGLPAEDGSRVYLLRGTV